MSGLPVAGRVGKGPARERVTLDYAGRFLRRKRLTTDDGRAFLVDLPQTVSLEEGDRFELSDGSAVAVTAAPEALLSITGDLTRAAWHIGNRHTPCQIAPDRLLIQDEPVMAQMLATLGLSVDRIRAPFEPERGAYGHGRTHGHSHDHHHDADDHAHSHG